MSNDTSGTAFPRMPGESTGLSLRDYFAAKAMQGMLSDPNVACDGVRLARIAYSHADAMLLERAK